MGLPFKQKKKGGLLIREFSKNVDSDELVWHRDREDRLVKVRSGTGWMLQLENMLPKLLMPGVSYVIPKNTYHRVIKGSESLVVEIREGSFMKKINEKKSDHPNQYGAPEGSKRDKQLDATMDDLKSGDPERVERAYRRRERMEKQEREKKGFKNKPRSDTKKESYMRISESALRSLINDIIEEELSKKTKKTLKKKAEERGLTQGSVEKEYKKGLAAWATSGSRKGMGQHQWAMARVNSATPSKDWAVVKKSKAKKK